MSDKAQQHDGSLSGDATQAPASDPADVRNMVVELQWRFEQLKHWQQESDEHFQHIQQQAQRVHDEHERLEKQADALDERARELERESDQLSERWQELNNQWQDLESRTADLESARHNIDADRADVDQQRQALEQLEGELSQREQDLDEQRSELDRHRDELTRQWESLNEQRAELEHQRTALEQEYRQLDEGRQEQQREQAELNEQRQNLDRDRQSLDERKTQLNEQQQEIERQKVDIKLQAESIEAQHHRLEQTRRELAEQAFALSTAAAPNSAPDNKAADAFASVTGVDADKSSQVDAVSQAVIPTPPSDAPDLPELTHHNELDSYRRQLIVIGRIVYARRTKVRQQIRRIRRWRDELDRREKALEATSLTGPSVSTSDAAPTATNADDPRIQDQWAMLQEAKSALQASEGEMVRRWAAASATRQIALAILGLGVIVLLAYIASTQLAPAHWHSTMVIQLADSADIPADPDQDPVSSSAAAYRAILLGDPVLERAMAEFESRHVVSDRDQYEIRAALRQHLTVAVEDDHLQLTFRDNHPTLGTSILRQVALAFVAHINASESRASASVAEQPHTSAAAMVDYSARLRYTAQISGLASSVALLVWWFLYRRLLRRPRLLEHSSFPHP